MDRAALEQRADRVAQAWRVNPQAPDLGTLLADFAAAELSRPLTEGATDKSRRCQAGNADAADITQQEVTTVINWAKEHDLPIPAALFAHFKMSRRNQPQAETAEGAAAADQIIGQIEERFPNWRSYRDLIDCIDCTLHQLRSDAVRALSRPERGSQS
jgi:hypothetical protein